MKRKGYALITGASAGLGAVFARELAKEGYSLILTARRQDKLEQLKSELETGNPELKIHVIPADLTREQDLKRLDSFLGRVPIVLVINNAGSGKVGAFTDIPEDQQAAMDALDVTAMRRITEMSLRIFESRGGGSLLNVASSAGLIPAGPFMAQYYAAKAYTTSLTRGIAEELRQKNSPIYVGCLCPGPVNTEFNSNAGVASPLKGISPEKCVRDALRQMKRKKVVIVPALYMRLAIWGGRLLPQQLLIRLTANQQKKKLGG